jgi:hypothetical protein
LKGQRQKPLIVRKSGVGKSEDGAEELIV